MKFHILTDLKDVAWGGGNQFQKALRKYLRERNAYTEEIVSADAVLANSHHWGDRLWEVFQLKRHNPEIIIIHRVDGPVSIVRSNPRQLVVDKSIMSFNERFADGTIFQSKWSKQENLLNGMKVCENSIVIHNAPNPKIFFPSKQNKNNKKIKLVATSWSNNHNKGFDIYHLLDNNLDFNLYDMTFIGKTDKPFKNITMLDPLSSIDLAEKIRNHDIFVFASKIEACSNSLLEAIHCGLPAVVRNASSNPEVLGNNGELFNNETDVIEKIKLVSSRLVEYNKNLKYDSLDTIADKYINYCKSVLVTENYKNKPPIGLIDKIKFGRLLI